MNHTELICRVLKTIGEASENNKFKLDQDLNLEELKISEKFRNSIIDYLNREGYISGLSTTKELDTITININNPSLTFSGKMYLKQNSSL